MKFDKKKISRMVELNMKDKYGLLTAVEKHERQELHDYFIHTSKQIEGKK